MDDILFHSPDLPPKRAQKKARAWQGRYPGHFASQTEAAFYLRYLFTPADGTWAFKPNGKTGTTSTLYFLFHLTTGHPLSAQVQEENGMNEDQAAHRLVQARVFSGLLTRADAPDPQAYLDRALRLTTVRHPMARAISGFTYLCRSDELRRAQFFTERARMNALTGFDWQRDPHTLQGFLRYLEYLRIDLNPDHTRPVDSHFRPQVQNILPGVFRPDLVGRCEDLPGFFTAIAKRLDRPFPTDERIDIRRNRQAPKPGFDTPASQALVAEIFAEDFEAFGY